MRPSETNESPKEKPFPACRCCQIIVPRPLTTRFVYEEDGILEVHNFEGMEAKENVGIARDFGRRDTGRETDGRVGIGG